MTTKTFVFPGSDSSKQQEIDFLTAMVEAVVPGTYLAELFTKRLLDWFTSNTRNDFPSDVMEHLDGTLADLDKANAEVREYAKENDRLVKIHQQADEFNAATIERKNGEIKMLKDILNQTYAQRDNAIDDAAGLRDQLASMDDQLEAKESQIIALKAKLYDLMVG